MSYTAVITGGANGIGADLAAGSWSGVIGWFLWTGRDLGRRLPNCTRSKLICWIPML